MKSSWFRGASALVIVGLVIAACSSSTGAGGPGQSVLGDTTPPSIAAPSIAAPTSAANTTGVEATGIPTSLDPCQLVPAQEASALSGGSYSSGEESTTEGGGKMCTYGSKTVNVFMVIVGQAPDVATAQAGMAQAQAQIESQAAGSPIQTTQLSGIGDGAVFLSMSETAGGATINGSAIYVLKGTIFYGFSNIKVGGAAPTSAAMQAEARTVLGRLP